MKKIYGLAALFLTQLLGAENAFAAPPKKSPADLFPIYPSSLILMACPALHEADVTFAYEKVKNNEGELTPFCPDLAPGKSCYRFQATNTNISAKGQPSDTRWQGNKTIPLAQIDKLEQPNQPIDSLKHPLKMGFSVKDGQQFLDCYYKEGYKLSTPTYFEKAVELSTATEKSYDERSKSYNAYTVVSNFKNAADIDGIDGDTPSSSAPLISCGDATRPCAIIGEIKNHQPLKN